MSEIVGEGEARRFYDTVTSAPVGGGWSIELDGRVVKTPLGETFLSPTRELADVVVAEWDAQDEKVIPASMPVASLCNAAIDRIAPDRPVFIGQLRSYAASDLLCYWAEQPEDLVTRQRDLWQPILDWAVDTYGAEFIATAGIIPVDQPETALDAVTSVFEGMSSYELTGMVDLAGRLNSVLLALALWEDRIDEAAAFQAAFLDELFQEEQWGEDREAVQRRAGIRDEMSSTVKFLSLLAPS